MKMEQLILVPITSELYENHEKETGLLFYLWVELAREVLRHSHASRARLKLLLVQHAVHLTGLATWRGGAGPAGGGEGKHKTM